MPGKASRENGKKGGRPIGSKEDHTRLAEEGRAYILARVATELEPIVTRQIQQAKAGDGNARKDLLDRAYGKPKETVEVQGLEFTWPNAKS